MSGERRPIRLVTGSRLHFGLLSWGSNLGRRFGGLGLMIESPGLSARIQPGTGLVLGALRHRAHALIERLTALLPSTPPFDLIIEHAPPEHVGLGTGTQLSLAIARLLLEYSEETNVGVRRLAELTGRGRRSGVGLHGFDQGGLIVDGGRRNETDPPPLVARMIFPEDWRVVLVIPDSEPGLHGDAERTAFAELPPCPAAVSDRLCRLILLELLPAVAEHDLPGFGRAVEQVQRQVGEAFAPAQNGAPFSHPRFDEIARSLRDRGFLGIGQSSWGPTIYGFGRAGEVEHLATNSPLPQGVHAQVLVTSACNVGARVTHGEE